MLPTRTHTYMYYTHTHITYASLCAHVHIGYLLDPPGIVCSEKDQAR